MKKPLIKSKLKKAGASSIIHYGSKHVVAKKGTGDTAGKKFDSGSILIHQPKTAGTKKRGLDGTIVDVLGRCEAGQGMTVSNLIHSVKAGLPVKELDVLRIYLDLPMERLVPMLGISRATFHRRKATGKLDVTESDRVVRFARLLGRAAEVMESIADGRRWLTSPQVGLGGAVPLEYAQTEVGAREVESLLGRIEYGVYS